MTQWNPARGVGQIIKETTEGPGVQKLAETEQSSRSHPKRKTTSRFSPKLEHNWKHACVRQCCAFQKGGMLVETRGAADVLFEET